MMDGTAYRKKLIDVLGSDHAWVLADREPTPEVVCALVEGLVLRIEVLRDQLKAEQRSRETAEERIGRMEANALSDRLMRIMERANPVA
jgi:coenzyme F420-reducing hydrogenase gamma subunit